MASDERDWEPGTAEERREEDERLASPTYREGLTGGYGGDPEAGEDEEALQRTAGRADPDDLGSTSLESGMTAGGTDTTLPTETDTGGGYGGSTTGGSSSGSLC
jgi:hypothetical protein